MLIYQPLSNSITCDSDASININEINIVY